MDAVRECDDSQLCLELRGQQRGVAFHDVYCGDPASRVIRASDNFALIADIAPLAEGHVLMVPRRHFRSMAQLPRDLRDEFDAFQVTCTSLFSRHYGSPTILEHGSPMGASESCISHAHWHLIPAVESIVDLMASDGLSGVDIDSWHELRSVVDGAKLPYLYFRHDSMQVAFRNVSGIPRQYLRMKCAQLLGIAEPEWDWALSLHPEFLRATVKVLS